MIALVNWKWWTLAWVVGGLAVAGSHIAVADPGAAALAHLECVLEGKVNTKPGGNTAISPHVSREKKSQIEHRLKAMALDLAEGDLEVGKVRVDGKLAGVIVHKREGYHSDKSAAFAVALVYTGDRWLPAPVAASFENTGISMDLDLRRRAAAIERWMLRERSGALDVLRDQQTARMRRDIVGAITREELQEKNVSQMAEAFLDACRDRNRLRLLGMLGGLSNPLPRNWSERLKSVELATGMDQELPHGWRVLSSMEIPRAVVHHESTTSDGIFTLGYIDPAGEVPAGGVPPVQLLHIDMERDAAGAWRINLPAAFQELEVHHSLIRNEESAFDADLFNAFPKHFRQCHPAAPQSSPEVLWETMCRAMTAAAPGELLSLLALPDDDAPLHARTALGRASRFWWQLRSGNGGRAVIPLAFKVEGEQAMAMAQLYAFREPERTDIRTFHMVRLRDGWMWQSTGRQDPMIPVDPALVAWRDEQEAQWRNQWTSALLAPAAKINEIPAAPAPDERASEALVRKWLDAIATGDIETSLAQSAVLDDEEGHARLLRNLGYELSTRITEIDGDIIIRAGKHWTVICFRRHGDANPGMALMPVVATPHGPLLVPELDLFVGTRQRDFLNNVALERLDGYADPEVRADLKNLLQELNRELAPARR